MSPRSGQLRTQHEHHIRTNERKRLTRKTGDREQQERHIPTDHLLRVPAPTRRGDRCGEQSIRQRPSQQHVRSEVAVIILLLRAGIDLRLDFRGLGVENVDGIFVQTVDILFAGWDFNLDFVLLSRRGHCTEAGCRLVVSFGTPRDIVHVGELG